MSREARERFVEAGVEKARAPWEFHRKNFDGVPDDLRAAVVEGLALPDHYSPVDDMFAAQDDRIWLDRNVDPYRPSSAIRVSRADSVSRHA